jgi:hypothetical protein
MFKPIKNGNKIDFIQDTSYVDYSNKQYGTDGSITNDLRLKYERNPSGPIDLMKKYGGIINGYQPSIIRPIDFVSLDVKRDNKVLCNSPMYSNNKFQQWCSEENAMKYHAMRPLVSIDKYNNMLTKLFDTILQNNKFQDPIELPSINKNTNNLLWSAVFCSDSVNDIMKFIMQQIAIAVTKIPEMHKNGSWSIEQFNYTDPRVYQFLDLSFGLTYYKVLFNLYNALRSTSTEIETTLIITRKGHPVIISMNFITPEKMTEFNSGIQGHNLAPAGQNPQINVMVSVEDPAETNIKWNYGNTLQQNEFNKYGFYNSENNVTLDPKLSMIPSDLESEINFFQNNSSEFLLGPGDVRFTNLSGIPETVNSNKTNVYTIQNPNGNNSVQKMAGKNNIHTKGQITFGTYN